MHYFARVTAGLEAVAWREIEQTGAVLVGFGHRRIDFTYDGSPATLLALKSVDDVYLFITRLEGFDRPRASLTHFQALADVNFDPTLKAIATVRTIAAPPTYGITASHLGKRNYSRYDVEEAIQIALADTVGWHYIPNRPDEEPLREIELRVLIEEDWALVGIRLGAVPLHRRPYKIASRPGSLKAPVAYALCMLAELHPGDILLDPTCGAGTILTEAASLITEGVLIGVDINPDAIEAARHNCEAAELPVEVAPVESVSAALHVQKVQNERTVLLVEGDARLMPFPPATINAVVTNLPWGKQVAPDDDLAELYKGVVRVIEKALEVGGRVVILTDQIELLQGAVQQHPTLTLTDSFQISLFGSRPTIHLLHKEE
jgi:tRNA (guanine6-N2)-methyltransferase